MFCGVFEMKKIKIFFAYKHIDEPWGGANNFIRALFNHVKQSDEFEIVDSIDVPADILFMNQLGKGRGFDGTKSSYTLDQVKEWKKRNPSGKVIVRAVNLRSHSHPTMKPLQKFKDFISDIRIIKLLNFSDFSIFQSQYQKYFFTKSGYKGQKNIIIHNGASDVFNRCSSSIPLGDQLILFSTSMAKRKTKRQDLIARISKLPNVKVKHAGAWPKRLPLENVEFLGKLDHSQVEQHMRQSHFFFHPAQYDPCPNSVIEALCFGMPVIYHPGPGSSAELVKQNGIAIDEDNLEATISKARQSYDTLITELSKSRSHYSIKHAAAHYIDVFKRDY